jgi:hypothetical protein
VAFSNTTFTVEYTSAVGSGVWHKVQDFAAAPTNRVIELTVPATGVARFFRLRMPAGGSQAEPLRIDGIQPLPGSRVALTFGLPADQGCTVEYTSQLVTVPWSALTSYSAAPTNRTIRAVVLAPGDSGFYRLRTE